MSFNRFEDFWPFYLGEHSLPQCRLLHFFGSTMALTLVLVALITSDGTWLGLGIVAGYGGAWWGHFVWEKNRPATFKHPLLSFRADWKMYWFMLTGKLDAELARLGISAK
jgi:hypothetical protein